MVRVGQTVRVKVLEVDVARKRVALTMRLNDTAAPARRSGATLPQGRRPSGPPWPGRRRSAAMAAAVVAA